MDTMGEQMSDGKIVDVEAIKADEGHVSHLYSKRSDEVIEIGADLVPDDIDMYPRTLGTQDMPFRMVWADQHYGSFEPAGERDTIGSSQPFMRVSAKEFRGDLRGTVNGMWLSGMMHGSGWMLLRVGIRTEGIFSKVIRSSFTEGHYTVIHGPKAGVYIHPGAPYPGFKAGEPVVVERVVLPHEGCVSGGSGVTYQSVTAEAFTNGVPSVCVRFDVPRDVSGQYDILIRLY